LNQIAVVADIHLHDLFGGYGTLEAGRGDLSLRTLADTLASTRVFNESYPAFLAVLGDIVKRGIRDVVLLGDYSDDGQSGAVDALKATLVSWEETHGLRFYATFGNHDCYGPEPRHQTKHLTDLFGRLPDVVTSDENAPHPAIIRDAMRGMSTPQAKMAMARYGFRRPDGVIHWEAPEGADTLDASYLVEPQPGLWLLMLDANVFTRDGDEWNLEADAAWDHVFALRPYIHEWITDVVKRSMAQGKTLLALSHYPMIPLALSGEGEVCRTACTPSWQVRMPSLETGRRLAHAGLKLHFSGHMHVAAHTALGGLTNIAVPSPVAYPAGYAIVSTDNGQVDVEMAGLGSVPDFDIAFPAYAVEAKRLAAGLDTDILSSSDYPGFLKAHLKNLIPARHLAKDWPSPLLDSVGRSLQDVFADQAELVSLLSQSPDIASMTLGDVLEDYYVLRATGPFFESGVPSERRVFYRKLPGAVANADDVASLLGDLPMLLAAVLLHE
jgi:3',5'-cyclic AMP phosphodiesterase CpdA